MTSKFVPSGLAMAEHNYVGENQIWKDHVDHETASSKNWSKTWQFMKTDYKDLIKEDYPDACKKKTIPIPKHLQVAPAPPLEELVTAYPSIKPVPKTTYGQIGWRSSDKELSLEKYGRYCRPKGGLIGQLKWPYEAIG